MVQSKAVNDEHESSRSVTVIGSDDGCDTSVDPPQWIRIIWPRRVLFVRIWGDSLGFSLLREELLHGIRHLVPNGSGSVTTNDDHVGVFTDQIGAMPDR
jgi:hypothetical protein